MVVILNLETFLKESKEARKVFGRREIEIIFKQMEGFDLTQSEKNRLSRDIRQKFKFIKECSKFQDSFDLKKNKKNRDIINETLEVLVNDKLAKDFKKILLFGSFADNTFTKRSDIDICVVFKKDIPLKEATEFRIRTSGQVKDKVDIQVFNSLPQKIKETIMKNHRVLFEEKDFKRFRYQLKLR